MLLSVQDLRKGGHQRAGGLDMMINQHEGQTGKVANELKEALEIPMTFDVSGSSKIPEINPC